MEARVDEATSATQAASDIERRERTAILSELSAHVAAIDKSTKGESASIANQASRIGALEQGAVASSAEAQQSAVALRGEIAAVRRTVEGWGVAFAAAAEPDALALDGWGGTAASILSSAAASGVNAGAIAAPPLSFEQRTSSMLSPALAALVAAATPSPPTQPPSGSRGHRHPFAPFGSSSLAPTEQAARHPPPPATPPSGPIAGGRSVADSAGSGAFTGSGGMAAALQAAAIELTGDAQITSAWAAVPREAPDVVTGSVFREVLGASREEVDLD